MPETVPWSACLDLEAWVRKALAEGREAEVVMLLRTLSVERREKYRAIYAAWKRGELNGNGQV